MAAIDVSKYEHSPVHKAIILKDYDDLSRIIAALPRLCDPSEIHTESVCVAEEAKSEEISAEIDRRDVPKCETALHLAVKLVDLIATEMLMQAGANCNLQNEQGWSALQEAICNREEGIAKIIIRHNQMLTWARSCRRFPRFVGAMRRMRDFYMEITFHFESSVIPFISRIAPSDTYKIWKRGANLRADMTLAGFDGFKIQRSDQSILFLGDGSEDGKVPPNSLLMVTHKNKKVRIGLHGAPSPATEQEIQEIVTSMSKTDIYRPGINVTEAVLIPQMTWRKQEKTEKVGTWKAKVYDMHNVVFSIKSRRVPGAMTNEELVNSSKENKPENEFGDVLTEEERRQLEDALKVDSSDTSDGFYEARDIPVEDLSKQKKKGWLNVWKKRENKQELEKKTAPSRKSVDLDVKRDELKRGKGDKALSSSNSDVRNRYKDGSRESEYKKSLRPVLWLSPDFPLQTEELLPLFDILAYKVKAIRRVRELLTTKLPKGTFPVKVAIPLVPSIRVVVTFTKFEELEPVDEFSTPPSSPTSVGNSSEASTSCSRFDNIQDPFAIPSEYKWITRDEMKEKALKKKKAKEANIQKQ